MKIDRSRLKKCTSEVPAECQALISKLRSCSHSELLEELKQIDAWTFGKCELFHWIDVLDLSDSILEEACARSPDNPWELACDLPQNREAKELLLWVLHFTTLLIEHSFSRHLYNSMEHLVTLLSSCDMHVVLGVLNLLYMFSKRSNFITRLNSDKRQALLSRLNHLAESWGGKENGFGLADCCKEHPDKPFPASATTLHFEYYAENPTTTTENQPTTPSSRKTSQTNLVTYIHIENVDKLGKTPAQIMNDLLKFYNVPQERQMALFTHIRLAHSFSDYRRRLQCVQARLQALSVLVYSHALQENAHSLLHAGLLEELVELLELPHPHLVEIRAAALRALTSIIHLDRNPHFPKKPGSRLNMIIDVTGASSYHGFLPVLVRTCITTLTSPQPDGQPFPLPLATALFSFLYHLASYEAGGDALVSCGMMEILLKVINWPGSELEHITFVTRAVRVIDLITNIDMQGFQAHGGLGSFINRLDMEVNVCRKEQPFEIDPTMYNHDVPPRDKTENADEAGPSGIGSEHIDEREETSNLMEFSEDENTSSKSETKAEQQVESSGRSGKTCLPQRAALLKSMLNFLKKAIQEPAFSDSIRHVMEGELPSALKHIISNSEYYGPSLFLLAIDVVTVYVFQEPSLLSSLQDNGLTDVVLHALLIKDVPATREVLGSLPNVFSALCLNLRGLESFVKRRPFEKLFKVLISPTYLSAMRKRRSADPLGDTASNLGNAMDELMRHQPSLKVDATAAIIKLLEELCVLGCDPRYVCWRAANKSDNSPSNSSSGNRQSSGQSVGVGVGDNGTGAGGGGGSSSDEEEEDEEEASTSSHPQREEQPSPSPVQQGPPPQQPREKTPIALVDYIHNVMKFVDAILSNNSTDDHCREFVAQKGLVPLLSILGLPNLPVDYPVAQAAQSVASVCKSILNLAHEPLVLKTGLSQLNEVLNLLKPLHSHMESPGGSVLLHELASAPNLETAFTSDQATPLLHAMNAAHGYVVMFVHVCRTSQTEIRNLSMNHWGSDLGLTVLQGLSELYMSLVWESTLLLALCSDDSIPAGCDFGKEDMDKLIPPELRDTDSSAWPSTSAAADMGSNGMTTAMEALSTDPAPVSMEVDDSKPSTSTGRTSPSAHQLKYIKPLLGASSRLGRALAELFGLLVKLCMGSPIRQRRGQQLPMMPTIPNSAARGVACALNILLTRGLSWDKLPPSPIPKFKLTFLICSVGFTSPMLFDEKRHPYHLMLQKFVQLGGQSAFFSTFRWALSGGGQFSLSEGLEHPDLPDGTGEFLDAWLMLLEKMVNPKAILDSPHVGTSKCTGVYNAYRSFDPIKYLQDVHKKAFEAVMLMWGKKPLKNYGARMTESILSILRHILRGEKIIKERTEEEEGEETSGTSGTRTTERRDDPEADVNPEHLRQLMDMGFSRAHCVEALLHNLSVEQATDYLLSHPATLRRPDAPAGDSSAGPAMDLDLVDDQIIYAIAMSLGDNDPKKSSGPEEPVRDTPITQTIDDFTKHAHKQCLNLLDLMPDTVYRICDLLVTITKRNGAAWRDSMLRTLINEIDDLVDHLIGIALSQDEDAGTKLVECEEATKVAGRIYLYTLFFEGTFQEMRVPCAQIVAECGILNQLVRLLVISEGPLTAYKNKISKESKDGQPAVAKTPKWLAPLLLLIDRLEKVAVLNQRKQLMHKVTNRDWKWFDLSTGKWTPYSSVNNRLINEAYWTGEPSVRISYSRRRYLITFSCMTQVNEDSDNRRPITMGFEFPYSKFDESSSNSDSDAELTAVEGLDPSIAPSIVRACVKLLAIPVDRDTLHALMKLCLRLTRDYKNAEVFAREGGVQLLLDMTQASSFIGCISLSTLLIRHTLEEPRTLRLAMEKVIRSRTQPNIPPAYKEILFMTRQISSAVCRNPEVYCQVCEDILRVDISVLKRDDVDNRLVVKALPPNHSSAMPMAEDVAVSVIHDLLNALIKPVPVFPDDNTPTPTGSPEKKTSTSTSTTLGVSSSSTSSSRRGDGVRGNNATANGPLDDDDQIVPLKMSTDYMNNGKVEPEEAKKPLLPKSAILKMLAEAVRSYGAVANLITEHSYRAGQSEMVTEDTSALAFLLDKLLPVLPENSGDRQCSSMARMLIAAIASCNHSPDAQSTLVTEVKAALTRTLALPESSEKHAQLQLLIGLISTMIDSCPPTSHSQLRAPLKVHQYNNVNYIVRIMLRKGIITDLAKIPHSLDLSSPNMAGTINAALKPLETLSRIINQPMPGAVNNKFPKPKNRTVQEEPIGDQTGTTTSEATHAVGEEANEDAENTEHDISLNAESLEPTSESQVHEEGDEAALEDIMDQLLERDGSAVTEEPTSRSHRPMDIDEESLAMRDAEGDFDPTRDTTEDLMSSDSDSDSNPSDDNEDDVQDDEDEEEEEEEDDGEENEEEEEDEEEGSSNYEEDGMDYYEDVGEGIFRMLPSAERDGSNVVMIQHNFDNHENNSTTPALTRQNHPWTANFPLPLGLFEDLPSVSESNGIGSHPLLMAQGSLDTANTRAQRSIRQRRYQYLHLANSRNPNPPVILQRLLVPAAQTLPLSATQMLASNLRDTRVVLMDNSLGIFSNQEEEQIDFVDQSGYLFGPSLAATLNNIPTALHWWIEESKLLDGDSQPDCCVGVVHKLIPGLEKHRDAELAERKDKRKKQHADKETEKEAKEKEGSKTRESNSTNPPQAEQQQPLGSLLQMAADEALDVSRRLADAVEAAVEAVRQERSRDENVIEVTGDMEVTLPDEEVRGPSPPTPPPPPPPEENRGPTISDRNATLELAESIIDSVLHPSTEEATRLRRLTTNRESEEMNLNRPNNWSIMNDFSQSSAPEDESTPRESRDPHAWVHRFLALEQSRRENNANVPSQDPSASSSISESASFTEQPPSTQQQEPQQQPQPEQTPATSQESEPIVQENPQTPQEQPQESSQAQQAASQEPQLPDGVDPSFLAALPEEMRDEVIAEQLRLQRIRQRAQATVVEELTGPVEVNPEFLAALPPAIQEEVLAQQRLEQQRHAAASANPADPVDAAAFFQNLQPSLRQAILTDMEESQMSVLPPDLAEEAQNLRRQWEARNRHMMQERFLSHVSQGNTALSSILRNSGRGRGGARYTISGVAQRPQWNSWNPRGETSIAHQSAGLRLRGRQLLDHESMACLLVLLFVDEPKINTLRLHRVIRNLCYHGSTREWVVKALLSIMERSNDENKEIVTDFTGKFKRKVLHPAIEYCSPKLSESRNNVQSWLNISIDAALGCRANVFHIVRHGGKKSDRQGNFIAIHPQAAPTVCRHTLELLISLAKSFPGYFVPTKSKEEEKSKELSVKEESGAKSKTASKSTKSDMPDFWDMLVKLDSCASKKGKSVARTHSNSAIGSEPEQSLTSFESSAFGQLISMLHWSVVKRSSQLTDKLLRLLSLISIGLTEVNPYRRQDNTKNKKVEPIKEQSVAAPEGHLRLAVQVLTSKSCSEEGLEDATALLLNLSHCPDPTRQLILKLLLEGAMELANMVCEHINELMKELKVLNRELRRRNSLEEQPSTSAGGSGRGTLVDRFTMESVIVTAPSKVKAGTDLQLPSMSALISKTSSQAFFLRILKVIVQIREAVHLANKKKNENTQSTSDNAMDTTNSSQVQDSTVDDGTTSDTSAMDTTQTAQSETPKPSNSKSEDDKSTLPLLSESLVLDNLWETLSACLLELEHTPDHHAVLVLQPAVEAFFLVHSSSSTSSRDRNNETNNETRENVADMAPVSPIYSDSDGTSVNEITSNPAAWDMTPTPQKALPSDQLKFLKFAETHRTVLNQILRQTTTHLADGPFSVLVDHTRVLDFDVKRRYFRTELERMDEGIRREELAVHVRRSHVFEDSFRELHRRNADEWKNRFYIVFEGEEGQDAGGLLREWYVIISREIFNPMYALFTVSPGDRVTYMINSSSHCNPNHLCYYKFVGRVIAKAIYDNKLLECYFTRSFYKHILGILVKHTDMESEDYSFYKGLVYLTENNISDLGYELTFSAEVNEFGVNDVRDLIPNGRNIVVTEETKLEYIRLVCQMKMTGAIRKQLNSFLEGFYDIIPKRLISIFNEQELELLISGLPNVDIEDLRSNTEYHKYSPTSLQIQWFWRALRGFDQADRAKFLQFVTGTSKVPLQGFGALEGMNGVQKFQIHRDDRSTDRLPSAHTCFNQLDLPVYETYDKLRSNLLKAIHECSEGFGFA